MTTPSHGLRELDLHMQERMLLVGELGRLYHDGLNKMLDDLRGANNLNNADTDTLDHANALINGASDHALKFLAKRNEVMPILYQQRQIRKKQSESGVRSGKMHGKK